jgi:CPA2 family monovalent cation:H+ antiporter-2
MTMAQIGEFSFIIAHLGQNAAAPVLLPIAVSVSVLTTLLTPYLIRNSDGMVDWFNRVAPGALVDHLKLYSVWVARQRETRGNDGKLRAMVRMWAVQVMLNLALTSGIFLVAAYLAKHAEEYMPWLKLPVWTGGASTVMWLGATLLSLPLLIATLRKVRAAAMLFAEMIVPRAAGGEHTGTVRSVLVNVILMLGTAVVGLGFLLLSIAILPTGWVLAVSVGVVFIVTALTWRSMVKVYAKAQIALKETLKKEVESEGHW